MSFPTIKVHEGDKESNTVKDDLLIYGIGITKIKNHKNKKGEHNARLTIF